MALDLAGSGWDVAIHCNRSAAEAEATAGEARALGARAAVLRADLLIEAEVETLVAALHPVHAEAAVRDQAVVDHPVLVDQRRQR